MVGRPNVGKSTLLNYLVGQKICITSEKPQTTRDRIMGIKTDEPYQLVYVDTPGIHASSKRALNRALNDTAKRTLRDLDVVVFLIEANRFTDEDAYIAKMLSNIEIPVIVVLNKVDRIEQKSALLPTLASLGEKFPDYPLVPISAIKQENLDRLEELLKSLLPESPFYFLPNDVSDRNEVFRTSELIREQIFRKTGQELPHSSAVQIETFKETDGLLHVHSIIWVEREGQKRIIIGEKGAKLKEIGSVARQNIEKMLGRKIYLNLWVKVKENWSDNPQMLTSLGLME